jgi:2-oxo-4-hydroxy-4-carboxy-5-ureidoimidazoline decarboxylase
MTMSAVDALNELSAEAFVELFGDIAEHSPWVASEAAAARPFADRAAAIRAFQHAILKAGEELQLDLLRAHPDLAGRAAIAGELTEDSSQEQAGAGLDRLTPEEFARFNVMNDAYRTRFGIPFIFAVKGAGKTQILESFAARVGGTREEEMLTAIAQVLRIVRFRLEARLAETAR